MAELVVRVPGEDERILALHGRAVTLGRGEECDLQLAEKRASRLHGRIEPGPQPGLWVVHDLGSSNGTFVGEARILRRALAPGDVIRIGDTTITLRDAATEASLRQPLAAITIGGALAVEAPRAAPREEAPEAGEAQSGEEEEGAYDDLETARTSPESARASLAGRRGIAQAALFLAVSVAALLGVTIGLGRMADTRARAAAEAQAYEALLREADRPYEILQGRLQDFVRDHPTSRHRADLELVVAARRVEHEQTTAVERELEALQRNAAGATDAEILARLAELQWRVGKGSPLEARWKLTVDGATRRRDEALARERVAAFADADRALAHGDVVGALRRLAAYENAHALLPAAEAQALADQRAAVRGAADRIVGEALATATLTKDPDARRQGLLEALRGLAGLAEGDRLRSAIVFAPGGEAAAGPRPSATAPGAPPAAPSPGAPSAGPSSPAGGPAFLAQAAEAERLARERKWAEAAQAYRALSTSGVAPRLQAEWAARAEELGRVLALVPALAEAVATAGERRLKSKLDAGTFEILAADGAGASLRRGESTTTLTWAEASPADLLAVLGAGKPTPERHLGLAVLAADLGDRAAAIAHLIPLVDLPAHRDVAQGVMARRLEGRAGVPEGGYVVLDGDLVDRAELARRTQGKASALLEAEAAELLKRVAADPSFKALEKLRARRDELDRRRAYALLAIFDETHWPYPHDDPTLSRQYEIVTAEVDRRWRAVEEVWDEPLAVKLPKGAPSEKLLERHAAIRAELKAMGRDVGALEVAIAPYALYLGAGTLTIRDFYRDADERDLFAYNRWVMGTYNPARTAVATDGEREQVHVTNEYRTMMGWSMVVEPGPTPYADVTRENVAAVLDQGREKSRKPLRAVRLDERCLAAARGHSMDMERRGFFSHPAPANPATGEPATSPFDRMQRAGYLGSALSENIAMASSPLDAHLRWLRSSGHHRNIVSDWDDLGSGQAGNRWTQNFGAGGGGPILVPGRAPAKPDETPSSDEEPSPR